jgi:hypothetical protein
MQIRILSIYSVKLLEKCICELITTLELQIAETAHGSNGMITLFRMRKVCRITPH